MQCKVSKRLTPPELHSMIPEEEEVEEDIEVEAEVEEDLVEVDDRSYVITMDSKVTMHGTARRLPATTVKPSITLLKNARCCLPRFKRSIRTRMSNSLELNTARWTQL